MSAPVPELSIVIPCFNEIDNVAAITQAVSIEAETYACSHEIILIDNGSTDGTRAAIRAICAADPRVRAIFNTRNFGQMRSPTHGIYQARGRAVIGMCADFQDPPELIRDFMRHWRAGMKIVLGQRRSERTTWLHGALRRGAYAAIARIADHPPLPEVTGFGLYDRCVVDQLARWNEPEPFFRGMLVESGWAITLIPFDRPERAAGESKNDARALLGFALSALSGSTRQLLRLPLALALASGAGAALLALAGVIAALYGDPLGWPLLGCGVAAAMFALVMLALGLIGDQVRLIAERLRGVPLVIEEQRINFPESPGA